MTSVRFNAMAQHRWKTCCQKYVFICLVQKRKIVFVWFCCEREPNFDLLCKWHLFWQFSPLNLALFHFNQLGDLLTALRLLQLQVFKGVFCEIFPKCSHLPFFFGQEGRKSVRNVSARKWKLWVMVLQWFIAALSWKWCRCLSCHFLQLLIWEIERILCKIWSGQLLFDALDPLLSLLLLAIHSATNILQLLQLLQLNVKLKEHTYKTFDK